MFLSKQDWPWNNIWVEELRALWAHSIMNAEIVTELLLYPEILTHVWKIAEIMNHFIMIVSTPRDSHEMNEALYNFVWSK